MRYRTAAADADGVSGDDDGRGQLLAFEFVGRVLDLIEDAVDKLGVVAGGDDGGRRGLLLEVHLEDRVHQVVGRQAVLVELVRGELGGRAFVDDGAQDDLPALGLVDVTGELPNLGLEQIALI